MAISRVPVNFLDVATEAIDTFCRREFRSLHSTAGRRLRIYDGRAVRHLSDHEKMTLWMEVNATLRRRYAKETCTNVRTGLRAIGLLCELPPKTSRGGKAVAR